MTRFRVNVSRMADHYLAALDALEEAVDLSEAIISAHDRAPDDRRRLGLLHHQYGHVIKVAEIHAVLSVRQQLQDSTPQPVTFQVRP